MAEQTTESDNDSTAGELRGQLVKRLAVAGVLVAILLGVLAFFDYLANPPDEAEPTVFTQPVPVAPKKEVSQPVTPTENLPEPPSSGKPEVAAEAPPPPSVESQPAAVVEVKPKPETESRSVVIAKPGARLDADGLVGALKAKLANFKIPKRCFIAAELPRNTMGKVQKNLLREQHKGLFA